MFRGGPKRPGVQNKEKAWGSATLSSMGKRDIEQPVWRHRRFERETSRQLVWRHRRFEQETGRQRIRAATSEEGEGEGGRNVGTEDGSSAYPHSLCVLWRQVMLQNLDGNNDALS